MSSHTDNPDLVFVVGAGASKEAGLPVGNELTLKIETSLNFSFNASQLSSGDSLIYNSLSHAAPDRSSRDKYFDSCVHASQRIAAAMPQAMSIDNFLDVHSEDEYVTLCGKLAIVRTILEAEATSFMKVQDSPRGPTLSFRQGKKTFYSLLFQILTENCKFADLSERLSKVAFVVFNYDRCIEHYLHYAVRNYYDVNQEIAIEALSRLRIYHPYGVVGSLPMLRSERPIGFGSEPTPGNLVTLAKGIRTFTEGTDPESSEIDTIRQTVHTCKRLVFLGFAFHRMNVDLLAPNPTESSTYGSLKVFGTAHGISTSDVELISADITNRLNLPLNNIFLRSDLKCADLFGEYWRSLSMV
jgi:hypothetical protein